MARTTLQDRVKAARVYEAVTHMRHEYIGDNWRQLAEIHAAPQWLWPALVARLRCDKPLLSAGSNLTQMHNIRDNPPILNI